MLHKQLTRVSLCFLLLLLVFVQPTAQAAQNLFPTKTIPVEMPESLKNQLSNFSDNFETSNAKDWEARFGTWAIVQDGATKVYQQTDPKADGRSLIIKQPNVGWYMTAKVKISAFSGDPKDYSGAGLLYGYQKSDKSFYWFGLCQIGGKTMAVFHEETGVNWVIKREVNYNILPNTWYTLKVVFDRGYSECYINDVLVLNRDSQAYPEGKVGLRCLRAVASFDDVTLK